MVYKGDILMMKETQQLSIPYPRLVNHRYYFLFFLHMFRCSNSHYKVMLSTWIFIIKTKSVFMHVCKFLY